MLAHGPAPLRSTLLRALTLYLQKAGGTREARCDVHHAAQLPITMRITERLMTNKLQDQQSYNLHVMNDQYLMSTLIISLNLQKIAT